MKQIEGQTAVVLMFTTDWCGPCKAIKPIFADYSIKYSTIKFIAINKEKLPEIAQQFGVTAVPTFISMHEGNIQTKWKGANQVNLKQNLDLLAAKVVTK